MKSSLSLAILLLFITVSTTQAQDAAESGVHQFTMKNIDGGDVSLSDFAGKLVLIVNTASKCGYTPQYASLEKLYQRFEERGLRILAFPANNFGAQEPGSNEEIKEFCSTTFDVTFDMFSKISVKGDDIHPLYAYLTGATNFTGEIRWNFTKFLVDENGQVVARFETKTDPMDEKIVSQIESMLNE